MDGAFLRSERLLLRPVEPEDAVVVAACTNDPQVRRTFFTHTPVSVAGEAERLRGLYRQGADYLPLVIVLRETGRGIGVTAFHRVDHVSGAAVFSLCLSDTGAWGHGYASEATRAMLAWGFDVLNLHRIQLHVWAGNTAARRIYEECGFVEEGVLREAMRHDGRWEDFVVMGLLEGEWRHATLGPQGSKKANDEVRSSGGRGRQDSQ